ncbi:MAG: MBL fold metallo-hydrolase [Chloroflexi bacterium]|nr:MBL fold metallo-hydrolase [Chloroflexota bacterium]MBV9896453.1 MBL fold metallo-hydrolase [Chloroflexota bacterium]
MSTSHAEHVEVGPPRVEEVSSGIYAYLQPDGSWFLNNTGFLVGRRGIVSIDTTSTERRTRAYLEAMGKISRQPIRTLINTHHHGDHTHGNCLLPLATIIGHPRCREEILNTPFPPPPGIWSAVDWGDLHVEPPFVTFEDRLSVWVDALRVELHVVPTPAHTTNDVVVWIPDRSVLFTGDLLFVGGTPFVPMGSVSGSLRALEWLRGFGATVLVPGHGPVSGPNAIDDVEAYLRFVQDSAQSGKAAGLTPLELARQTDLGRFTDWADRERIVGNLHRAYAELDGAEPGASIDTRAALMDMVAYNDGRPLTCLA